MGIITWIMLTALIIVALWDIYTEYTTQKGIPSAILTALIIVPAMVNYQVGITTGIIAALFGLLIGELFSFSEYKIGFGIADIKIMTAIGCMLPNITWIFAYLIILSLGGLSYVMVWKTLINKDGYVPYIPVYAVTYILLMIVGGII